MNWDLRLSRRLYAELEHGERIGSRIPCGFVGCVLIEIQVALKESKNLHMAGRFFMSTTVMHQFPFSILRFLCLLCVSDLAATYHCQGPSGDKHA